MKENNGSDSEKVLNVKGARKRKGKPSRHFASFLRKTLRPARAGLRLSLLSRVNFKTSAFAKAKRNIHRKTTFGSFLVFAVHVECSLPHRFHNSIQ